MIDTTEEVLLGAPASDGWWVWINGEPSYGSELMDCLMIKGGTVADDYAILEDLGLDTTRFVDYRENGGEEPCVSNYYEGCDIEWLRSQFDVCKFRKPTEEELADWKKHLLGTVPGL